MLWYTVLLIALSVLPVTFGVFGLPYLISALVLGGILLRGVWQIRGLAARGESWIPVAWKVYKYSLLYLALLFVAMAVDRHV
jgi:protoheme IX farnesyltransferase